MKELDPNIFIYAEKAGLADQIKGWVDKTFKTPNGASVIYGKEHIEPKISNILQPLLIYIGNEPDETTRLLLHRLACNEQRIQIMLCASAEFALDAWGVEVAYYVPLPVHSGQFSRPIARYLQFFRDERNFNGLNIKYAGMEYPVRYRDILYVKGDGNYCDLHLANGKVFKLVVQIHQMEARCSGSLLLQRVDRSLMINIARIKAFDREKLLFISDKNIGIDLSRGKFQRIRNLLYSYFK